MKEKFTNDPSFQLMQLLDGELDAGLESGVFDALGRDDALQAEFKDHIAIREAVKRDVEAFTPPPELASAVFNRVGLTHPSAIIPPKRFAWKRYSVLLLLLLTGGSGLALLNDNNNKAQNEDKTKQVNSPAKVENSAKDKAVAKELTNIESSKNIASVSSLKRSNKVTHNDLRPKKNSLAMNNSVVSIAEEPVPVKVNSTEIKTESYNYNPIATANYQAVKMNSIADYYSSPFKTINNAKNSIGLNNQPAWNINTTSSGSIWSLRIRGIYALSSAERNLQSGSLKTFSVGVFTSLKVDDNLSLGMEFGMEPFSQVFTNSGDASGVKYDQQPTLSWIAIGARYEATGLAVAGINPSAQISFAGSELGPIVKGFVGLSYPTTNTLGINIGVESSTLFYKNQGVYNSTQKFGLTAGVQIKL